ncbi:hypothetical protein KY284_019243 [Solanum tuberosum]|nr:hypothetical protein KY284_019243 [Solanum tuberosum]
MEIRLRSQQPPAFEKLAKARLSKRAIERRAWPKFGDAVQEDVGSRLTMVST